MEYRLEAAVMRFVGNRFAFRLRCYARLLRVPTTPSVRVSAGFLDSARVSAATPLYCWALLAMWSGGCGLIGYALRAPPGGPVPTDPRVRERRPRERAIPARIARRLSCRKLCRESAHGAGSRCSSTVDCKSRWRQTRLHSSLACVLFSTALEELLVRF